MEGQRLEAPGSWGSFRGPGETGPLPASPLASAPGSSPMNFSSVICRMTDAKSSSLGLSFLICKMRRGAFQSSSDGHAPRGEFCIQPPIFQKRKLILEGQGFSWDTVVPEVCMSGPQRGFTHLFHLQGQAPSSGGKGGVGDGVARNSSDSSHGEKEGSGWLGPFWACPSPSCLLPAT